MTDDPIEDGTVLLRERETPEGLLVSVCDSDCLGETYDNGKARLEVDPDFYGGEAAVEADADAVVESLHRAQVANLVGTESVGVAIEAGLVDEETVLEFEDTRHAQLLWL
ncbi:Uncharacterized protein AArcCO_0116 [Halalkaliarchaeum sp. AArc-CO]|nr:Uncharacterized protein AArcCO_0116 [Halalkaliarchaeum sp. AArc-CO]